MSEKRKVLKSELDRILPIARETILQETKLEKARKQKEKVTTEIAKLEMQILRLEKSLKEINESSAEKKEYDNIKIVLEELKEKQQELKKENERRERKINKLVGKIEAGFMLCNAVVKELSSYEIKLEKNEIRKEYLKEYIYLLSLSNELELEKLFSEPVDFLLLLVLNLREEAKNAVYVILDGNSFGDYSYFQIIE